MTTNLSEVLNGMDAESQDEVESQHQFFYIPLLTEEDDLSGPPMNGEQYLRRVIEESKQCEDVVVANIKLKPQRNNQLPELPEKEECSRDLLFSKDWQVSAMADFSQLRMDMETLREKTCDDPAMRKLKKLLPKEEDEEEFLQLCSKQRSPEFEGCISGPSTRLCLAMSQQKTIWHLLSYLGDWISDGTLEIQDACRWVYSLLACLELPVEPKIYYSLREIARALISHRAKLESPEAEELPHINLIVCIIGRYFRQLDLADPYD